LAQEVELKLELTPHAFEAIIDSGMLPGETITTRLRSLYFDTPKEDLRAAGFTLRIRESGERRIQTVKAAGTGAAGLFARQEWEKPVESDSPVLDETTPLKALLGIKEDSLQPVFEVLVERRTWMISEDDAEFELVLDRGEAIGGDRREAFCEMEMELKRGSPSALFALARRMSAVAPLRPGVLNKAERGYRLLRPAVRAVKAAPVVLKDDMTAAATFRYIAGACLRQFRLNEALLNDGNSEAVHQARVALRRLRSAFTIYKAIAKDRQFDEFRNELRWLAATLGLARDLDVLMSRCESGEARDRLELARRKAYEDAFVAMESPRALALMLDLSEWLALGDWLTSPAESEAREQPAKDFAASALDRFRKKVAKGGRSLAKLDDVSRHEVRKDAKKLRYAAEFFSSLFGGKRQKHRCARFLETLEALQDKLGLLNDAASAQEVLARIGMNKDPVAAALLITPREKAALLDAAVEAHEAFDDAKPFWR